MMGRTPNDFNQAMQAQHKAQMQHQIDINSNEGREMHKLIASGQAMNAGEAINLMNQTGMMPFHDGTTTTEIEIINQVPEDSYDMLEHCGDLLATGVIKGGEWMKLKKLIRSGNEENLKLVQNIINAKIEQDVEEG